MQSLSISSSKRGQLRLAWMCGGTAFVFGLLALALAARVLEGPVASEQGELSWRPDEPASLVYDGQQAMDQDRYFHDLGGITTALGEADFWIAGNSRALCGFDRAGMAEFGRVSGRKLHHIGFGYDESGAFLQALLDRYEFRPKWVVVNCDASFWGAASSAAQRVTDGALWASWVKTKEFEAGWYLRRWLHRWVPRLHSAEKIAIWRAHADGAWLVRTRESGAGSVSIADTPLGPEAYQPLLERARDFQNALTERGARLVLTVVPSPEANAWLARQLAVDLNVPAIVVGLGETFATFDGDHLDPASAAAFTRAFLDEWAEQGL